MSRAFEPPAGGSDSDSGLSACGVHPVAHGLQVCFQILVFDAVFLHQGRDARESLFLVVAFRRHNFIVSPTPTDSAPERTKSKGVCGSLDRTDNSVWC